MSNVRLIATSQPRSNGLETAEELIMYVARVSNPSKQDSGATGLIDYCIREGHWSIFETASMTVEIETTLAIAPQFLRHRSFTFQQFSMRYAEATLGFENLRLRRQDKKNRQNSIDDVSEEIQETFEERWIRSRHEIENLYDDMLEVGVAKECARSVLPGLTKTRFYMTGSIRSWIHYLQVRDEKATQLEHQEIAQQIRDVFTSEFPVIAEAVFK